MKPFTEIETERLVLRKLKTSDWEAISYLRTDKEVNRFVNRPSAATKEEALAFILKINKDLEDQSLYYWSITENGQTEMIGSICLWNFSKDQYTGELGYDLSPNHQGKGVMSESLRSILDFGFNKLNLQCIEAYTSRLNESSIKLLQKNGFTIVKNKEDEVNPDNVIYEIKKP